MKIYAASVNVPLLDLGQIIDLFRRSAERHPHPGTERVSVFARDGRAWRDKLRRCAAARLTTEPGKARVHRRGGSLNRADRPAEQP